MSWASLRVPASSANLGPGFDALGLALDIYLDCRFRRSENLRIEISGRDAASIPSDSSNLIWQTACNVAAGVDRVMPPFELELHNEIPLGKGLGSSAAAVTAGVVIAAALLELDWDRSRVLDEAARLEGHPDNVAPCVLGGVVASALLEDGRVAAVRLDLPPSCAVAVVVPSFALPTAESRSVLPASWPREDVVYNLQHATLMVAALATGNTSALASALGDRLHQPYRAPLVPGLSELLALRAPGLYGCVLSGSGPSVLVFFEHGRRDVCDLVQSVFDRHRQAASILHASVSPAGYRLENS